MNNLKKIEDITLIQNLKSTLLGFWPERKNNNFPAPLPVSIERQNFKALKKFPYVISLKSNGTRYLLMAYNKSCYLVDRAFDFYETKQNFRNNIYGCHEDGCGMILDGELMIIKENDINKLVYFVHDCVCIFSNDIKNEPFSDRYDAIMTALSLWTIENSDFEILAKKFYMFKDITKEIITNAEHDIDGLIFTPVKLGIGTGTQYTLFKWKILPTFDFMVTEEPTEYCLSVLNNKTYYKYASVKKKNARFNKLLKERCPTYENGSIIEFSYNGKIFEPLFIRKDKVHPNNKNTVDKTYFNIEENITLDEILKIIKECDCDTKNEFEEFENFEDFTEDLLD